MSLLVAPLLVVQNAELVQRVETSVPRGEYGFIQTAGLVEPAAVMQARCFPKLRFALLHGGLLQYCDRGRNPCLEQVVLERKRMARTRALLPGRIESSDSTNMSLAQRGEVVLPVSDDRQLGLPLERNDPVEVDHRARNDRNLPAGERIEEAGREVGVER